MEEETEESFAGLEDFSLENVQNIRRRHKDKTNLQSERFWPFVTGTLSQQLIKFTVQKSH